MSSRESVSRAGFGGRDGRRRASVLGAAALALGLTACASGRGGPGGAPGSGAPGSGAEIRRSALPPIPHLTGPVRLRVEYPDSMQLVAVRDSNFLFGSVGTGDAELTVNGRPVAVEPNGSFLAWIPLPEPDTGGVATYTLVARPAGGGLADTLRHPIRRPVGRLTRPDGDVWIDSSSVRVPGVRWALPDEQLRFAVRAAPGSSVSLSVGNRAFSMEPDPGATAGVSSRAWTFRASLAAGALERAVCSSRAEPARDSAAGPSPGSDSREVPCLGRAEPDPVELRFVARRGEERAVVSRAMRLRVLDPDVLPAVALVEAPDPVHGRSGVVVGSPITHGPYHWRFPVGTRAVVDARRGDRLRLRLVPGLHAWVRAEDVHPLARGTVPASATVGNPVVEGRPDRLRVHVPVSTALPLRVEVPDARTLELQLYGARGGTERMVYGESDPLLESLRWSQQPGPVYRLRVRLSRPVWGYRTRFERVDTRTAGDGTADAMSGGDPGLVLEIRRPPEIDAEEPLRGRRVAVDAGHPGAGAYGPTGYYEGDANLAIAGQLARMLRDRGAEAVMIRSDTLPMGLYERTAAARAEDAELFVSIHNNALPDGVRPFGREGSSTFYYHPHARELARAVQRGMLESMGLRDRGVRWGNLAVTRMPWMPAVLTEGAFMMMPRHEAALKTEEFQRAYARGVMRGLERFLRDRARANP